MGIKKRICIIMFSNLKGAPRVIRQINTLKDKFSVTTVGLRESNIHGVKEFTITDKRSTGKRLKCQLFFLLARLFKHLYIKYNQLKYPTNEIVTMLSGETFDLIIAHGLETLVSAEKIALRDHAVILLDAHEYEPRRIEDHWFHKFFVNPYKKFLCIKYLSPKTHMTTVSHGIAKEFSNAYGVKPSVIFSAPKYEKIELKRVKSKKIHLIHHGIAHPSRNLEDMIHLMRFLEERFHLTLMLVNKNNDYLNYLKKLGDNVCPEQIHFTEPVSFDKIVSTISENDIELIIYKPTSFNIKHALPNKFFESIMAGLAIVIGPSPDMKEIVEEFNCGFAANSFKIKDIAKMINSLSPEDIMKKKKASLEAAKILNAEKEMENFIKIVKNLIGD